MPPIYIMAALTVALTALLWGGAVYALSGRKARYLWLLLPGLPLSALVNLAVKRPVGVWLGEAGGVAPGLGAATPLWFILSLSLLPPLTEEAIKLLPLVLPSVRRGITGRSSALWTGMALGISFGLGEALFLAYGVARSPEYAGYPWYAFTGYLGERMTVSLAHGLLTALVLAGIQRGAARGLLAYLAAVALHLLINAGATLAQLDLIPLAAAGLSLIVALLVLAALFEWLRKSAVQDGDGGGEEEIVYYRRDDPGEPG